MRIKSVASGCLWFSILLCLLRVWSARSEPAGGNSADVKEMSSKTIQQALEAHNQELLSIPSIVGTAQGLCESTPCIRVMVRRQSPSLERKILSILKGYPVRIEETGSVRTRHPK
jgi:hypothetical protein